MHAVDVFWAGFFTNQNDLFALERASLGVFRSEGQLTNRCTRRSWQALGNLFNLSPCVGVEAWQQQLSQVAGWYAKYGSLFFDQLFTNHFASDTNCSHTGTLTSTSLQHVQSSLLNGELDVLHLFVVLLKDVLDFHQLLVNNIIPLAHLFGWLWCANTSNHVFTLSIHKELTEELVFASVWIASKGNASTRIIAHVAVYHRLAVNSSTEQAANVFDFAILHSLVGHPALEDRFDRLF